MAVLKTFHHLEGGVMIWIKIVRLAVSSYHSAAVLYDLSKELSFSAPVMPLRLSGIEASVQFVLRVTIHTTLPSATRPNPCVPPDQQVATTRKILLQEVLLHAPGETGKTSALWHWCGPEHHSLTKKRSTQWAALNMITLNDINYTHYNIHSHEQSSSEACVPICCVCALN